MDQPAIRSSHHLPPTRRRIARCAPRSVVARTLIVAALTVGALSTTALAGGRIIRFLLRANEQPGFTLIGRITVTTSLRTFLRTLYVDRGRRFHVDFRRLHAEGFSVAAQEVLQADNGREGFSLVIKLATPAAARAETRYLLRRAIYNNRDHTTFTRFRVPGVSSAHGVISTGGRATGATANVYWVEGRCLFGSGDYVPLTGPVSEPVIAGVQALDRRTAGTCP